MSLVAEKGQCCQYDQDHSDIDIVSWPEQLLLVKTVIVVIYHFQSPFSNCSQFANGQFILPFGKKDRRALIPQADFWLQQKQNTYTASHCVNLQQLTWQPGDQACVKIRSDNRKSMIHFISLHGFFLVWKSPKTDICMPRCLRCASSSRTKNMKPQREILSVATGSSSAGLSKHM